MNTRIVETSQQSTVPCSSKDGAAGLNQKKAFISSKRNCTVEARVVLNFRTHPTNLTAKCKQRKLTCEQYDESRIALYRPDRAHGRSRRNVTHPNTHVLALDQRQQNTNTAITMLAAQSGACTKKRNTITSAVCTSTEELRLNIPSKREVTSCRKGSAICWASIFAAGCFSVVVAMVDQLTA